MSDQKRQGEMEVKHLLGINENLEIAALYPMNQKTIEARIRKKLFLTSFGIGAGFPSGSSSSSSTSP